MVTDTPAPKSRIELYTHEPMTNWLSPSQLLQTGVRAAIATTLGSYADARDLQAVLNVEALKQPLQIAERDITWIDYVADTGDGWDSTYSVAWSISREQLNVADGAFVLPRANLLILGGDQVYPTPAEDGYRTRFIDPYRGAFPSDIPPRDEEDAPQIVAIPGNHDWYDGLRGFTSLFCARQAIGRWKTVQRTSYFAARLPHGWWLWGLDLQLESLMDAPQLNYFKCIAAPLLQAGDRVIICAPEPSWIDESERLAFQRSRAGGAGNAAAARPSSRESTSWLRSIETQTPRFLSLRKIEGLVEACEGVCLAAVLTGDQHHYARYEPDEAGTLPQRVTCGGGGAYLLGTHHLPEQLCFKSEAGNEERYKLSTAFPDAAWSRRLRNAACLLPIRNSLFCLQLAALYLLYLWVIQSASKVPNSFLGGKTLMAYLAQAPVTLHGFFDTLLPAVAHVMAHSPASMIFTLFIVVGPGLFTMSSTDTDRRRACIGGMLHGMLHLMLAFVLLWLMGYFNLGWVARSLGMPAEVFLDDWRHVLLFIVETSVFGGVIGGFLFGGWMVLADAWFGWHSDEVFSSQGIADGKSFLRMRIDADGLTIYPIKIERVCKNWKTGIGVQSLMRAGNTWRLRAFPGSGARFVPADPIKVELIETPIHISSKPKAPT
ncbi:preprotein translocase subunit YajC [Paralcaligenes ginsengisoli]